VRVPLIAALAALAAGCASAFPADVVRSVDRAATVSAVQRDPAAYAGVRVMVGGDIIATRPRPGETEIEILSKPLESDDRPRRGDVSDGRVLVHSAEFLDPAVYAEGRRVTVVGTVSGAEERKIGELPYRYPVVASVAIRLWPRDEIEVAYPPPWPYYSPFPYPYVWRRFYGPWPPWPYWW